MKTKFFCWLAVIVALLYVSPFRVTNAQTSTPAPLMPPNVLLVYDKTTVAVINTSSARISLNGLAFVRHGGDIKFNAIAMMSSLEPGHCFQVWIAEVRTVIGKPDECTARDRWQKLNAKASYFWVAESDNEQFRPKLNNSTLRLCNAAAATVERCPLYIPQGADAQKPWDVLDPATNLPMPAGLQVAYDANQIWIGNFTANTVLPTRTLRLFYKSDGKDAVWTPSDATWDIGKWDGLGLQSGQCLVLYQDPVKIIRLLPCIPVAKAVVSDQPWRVTFDVMGPREERRSTCGSDTPPNGATVCILAG